MTLSATDLELGVRSWVDSRVDEEGGVAVPGRPLAEFVTALTDEEVTLELCDLDLHLRSPSFHTELRGVSAGEFPEALDDAVGQAIEVDGPSFVEAIQDVQFASSTDEARTLLTGVLITAESDTLIMAATDGARLAERKLPCGWSGPKCTLIVPHRALAEVARAFKGEAGPLQVMVAPAGNQVSMRGSATEVRSRVLDGTYPDYRRIIPPSCSTTIAIDAAEFAGRLRAVSVFARDEAHVVRLRATEGALELRAATREVGEASTRLDAAVGGPDSALALNVRYLLDGLARIGGEARLLLDGPLAPVILRRDDDYYTYLIAPIRQPVRP